MKVCYTFKTHFCIPIHKIEQYIAQQLVKCRKPREERYFSGSKNFMDGIPQYFSSQMGGERKNKTLLLLTWMFDKRRQGTIKEEKLVYSGKDLLAWIGGALGIFVGYSFFDFFNHVVDIIFHCIKKRRNMV